MGPCSVDKEAGPEGGFPGSLNLRHGPLYNQQFLQFNSSNCKLALFIIFIEDFA